MKKMFQYLSVLAFLLILGTAGGIQHGNIGLFGGVVLMFTFLGVWILCCKLGGMFYER